MVFAIAIAMLALGVGLMLHSTRSGRLPGRRIGALLIALSPIARGVFDGYWAPLVASCAVVALAPFVLTAVMGHSQAVREVWRDGLDLFKTLYGVR